MVCHDLHAYVNGTDLYHKHTRFVFSNEQVPHAGGDAQEVSTLCDYQQSRLTATLAFRRSLPAPRQFFLFDPPSHRCKMLPAISILV